MAKQTLQETMDRLYLLIRSGYPAIYVVSYEETRVLEYISKIVARLRLEDPQKGLVRWFDGIGFESLNIAPARRGEDSYNPSSEIDWLTTPGLKGSEWSRRGQGESAPEALRVYRDATLNLPLKDSVAVLYDLHPYLRGDLAGGSQVRAFRNTVEALRKYYDRNRSEEKHFKTMIVVAPIREGLSAELERDLIVIDFPLPETDELLGELKAIVEAQHLTCHKDIESDSARKSRVFDMVAAAGRGLTLEDYRRGLNMISVRGKALDEEAVEYMLDLKANKINDRALQYFKNVETPMGGMKPVEDWIQIRRDAAISPEVRKKYRLPALKGMMLCGVSGGGKSKLAQATAKSFNLALLRLDVGALFGSYVGESERRTREALKLAEVLSPIVLWIDEIDKAFSGMGGSGDNGVSARVFGAFLTWLSEKEDSVFVVTTANDYKALMDKFPEFFRKGRFDEIFWVTLPNKEARKDIFRIYLEPHWKDKFLVLPDEDVRRFLDRQCEGDPFEECLNALSRPERSIGMTGAEIEHSVHEALFLAYDNRSAGSNPKLTIGDIEWAVQEVKKKQQYSADQQKNIDQEPKKMGWIFANKPASEDAVG